MPRAVIRRRFGADPDEVWAYVTDLRNLPRWWPRTASVRDGSGRGATVGSRWVQALETKQGNRIQVGLVCTKSDPPNLWRFEQVIPDSPFERMLTEAWTEMRFEPSQAGTSVELELGQKLRGLARFGILFVRSASRRTAREALEGLAAGLGEESQDDE